MDINQKAYSSEKTVGEYKKHETLQKGEAAIFEKFNSKITNGAMLDIGIGGGRTTSHLVSIARSYVGIDFSQPFVDHCQAKFGYLNHVIIKYGDARDLNDLKDQSFDFIFFSFNGIDYVDFDDRKKILMELSRLLNTGGVLSFSFHNKGNLDRLYSFQPPRNPFKYFWEWQRMNKVRDINGAIETYKNKDWFIIKDGGEDFMADTLYIDPIFQQRCLEDVGFKSFYFHDAVSGVEMSDIAAQNSNTPWIYITAIK